MCHAVIALVLRQSALHLVCSGEGEIRKDARLQAAVKYLVKYGSVIDDYDFHGMTPLDACGSATCQVVSSSWKCACLGCYVSTPHDKKWSGDAVGLRELQDSSNHLKCSAVPASEIICGRT
eukprot:2802236-Amphidinium_carterae.1